MAAICKRLLAFGEFELVIFGDDVITEQPVDEWPLCDALLSWHSEGFPLKKVMVKSCALSAAVTNSPAQDPVAAVQTALLFWHSEDFSLEKGRVCGVASW